MFVTVTEHDTNFFFCFGKETIKVFPSICYTAVSIKVEPNNTLGKIEICQVVIAAAERRAGGCLCGTKSAKAKRKANKTMRVI